MGKADQAARRWHKDSKIYAISSYPPKVDAQGRAPSWLYTYVSPSGKSFASFLVTGGKVKPTRQGSLPEKDIKNLVKHALPPQSKLLDSTQAVKKAPKFESYLKKNPGTEASAGLDSFSSKKPAWILNTVSRGKRIEEKVPAVSGGSS